MGLAGRDDIVVGLLLLHHHPHHLHVVSRVPPVALRVDVAHVEPLLQPLLDARNSARHLARHERRAATRRLVVEEDAVAQVHAVRLAVVDYDPVGVLLGHRVRRTRVEGSRLALRHLLHEAVQLARRGLVEARLLRQTSAANRIQHAQHSDAVAVGGILGHLERDLDVALGAQVVQLVRPHLGDDLKEVGGVGQVAVVQEELGVVHVRVLVQVLDAARVEGRRATDDAVHVVALLQQEPGRRAGAA